MHIWKNSIYAELMPTSTMSCEGVIDNTDYICDKKKQSVLCVLLYLSIYYLIIIVSVQSPRRMNGKLCKMEKFSGGNDSARGQAVENI